MRHFFLILLVLIIAEQSSVVCDVETGLIFPNPQSAKDEKSTATEFSADVLPNSKPLEEVTSATTESPSDDSQQSLELNKVISSEVLPNSQPLEEQTSAISESPSDDSRQSLNEVVSSEEKKEETPETTDSPSDDSRQMRAQPLEEETPKTNESPSEEQLSSLKPSEDEKSAAAKNSSEKLSNPEPEPTEQDYEDDEEKVAEKIQQLTDPNSPYNAPIVPPIAPNNQPNGTQADQSDNSLQQTSATESPSEVSSNPEPSNLEVLEENSVTTESFLDESRQLRGLNEVIRAGEVGRERTSGELIKEPSESLMQLPKVINLPRDNESSNQQSVDGKSPKGRKGHKKIGQVKGKVLDGRPGSEKPAEPDYEDDEDNYDDYEIAKQIDQLTDSNSPYNAPIVPPIAPSQSGYSWIQENAVRPNDYENPSLTYITNNNPPFVAQPAGQQAAVNAPIAKPFKGEASFNFQEQPDPMPNYPAIDGQPGYINPPLPPLNERPGSFPPAYEPLPENRLPANEQLARPFNGDAPVNFGQPTDFQAPQQTNPLTNNQGLQQPNPYPPPAYEPSQPFTVQQPFKPFKGEASFTIEGDDDTRPTGSLVPDNQDQQTNLPANVQWSGPPAYPEQPPAYPNIQYSPATPLTAAPQNATPTYVPLRPLANEISLDDPTYVQLKPLANEISLDEPSQTKNGTDFIEEAAKLSDKIGFKPPANEESEPIVNEEADSGTEEGGSGEGLHGTEEGGSGEEPHGTDNKEENDSKLPVPSVYQTFQNEIKQSVQAVDNPKLKTDVNPEPVIKSSPAVVPNAKPTIKILNASPKIVTKPAASSFPSMDLFRSKQFF